MGSSIIERDRSLLDSVMISSIPLITLIKGLGPDAYKLSVLEREISEDRVKVEVRYPAELDGKVRELLEPLAGEEHSIRELVDKKLIPQRELIIQEKQGRHYVIDRGTGLIIYTLPRLRIISEPTIIIEVSRYISEAVSRIGDYIVHYTLEYPESLVSTNYIRLIILSSIKGLTAEKIVKPLLIDRINSTLFTVTSRKNHPEYNKYIGKGLVSHVLGSITREALSRILLLIVTRRFDNLLYVETPVLAKKDLYVETGHLKHFSTRMYRVTGRDSEYILRPMNCPHHLVLMKTILKHYPHPSDLLPLATYEFGRVFRDEPTGTLEPLIRVRQFTQDDIHVLLPYPRVKEYLEALISDTLFLYSLLGIRMEDLEFIISVHDPNTPGKYLFSDLGLDTRALWMRIEEEVLEPGLIGEVVRNIVEKLGLNAKPNILVDKTAAFYGPKLDLFYTGGSRYLRLFTAQLDVSLPRIMGLDEDTGVKDLVLIHAALAGSLERFIGVLLENKSLINPVLAPIQALIVFHEELLDKPGVADVFEGLKKNARKKGLRILVASTGLRRIGVLKNRALVMGTPFLIVIGPRELESHSIQVQDTETSETITTINYENLEDLADGIINELEKLVYEDTRMKLSKYLARSISIETLKIPYTPPEWIINYKD